MVFSCGLVDCGVGRVCRTIVPMTPCRTCPYCLPVVRLPWPLRWYTMPSSFRSRSSTLSPRRCRTAVATLCITYTKLGEMLRGGHHIVVVVHPKTLLPAQTSTSSLSTPSLNSFNTRSHCLESCSSLFNTSAFRPATLAIFLPSLWMKKL